VSRSSLQYFQPKVRLLLAKQLIFRKGLIMTNGQHILLSSINIFFPDFGGIFQGDFQG
jgi:hypothetical protein